MIELLGKSKEELRAFCATLDEPAYRGGQIYHALYAERRFDFARMTNLPAALRERLAKEARITLPEVKQRFVSTDGSVRYLFGLREKEGEFNTAGSEEEGTEKSQKRSRRAQIQASVEAVYMPSEGRQTICISTQAGCAVDCHFCLTAQLGLIRNLTGGEILAQALVAREEHGSKSTALTMEEDTGPENQRRNPSKIASGAKARIGGTQLMSGLKPRPPRHKVGTQGPKPGATETASKVQTNVVLMGQGEPLLNFEPVMAALRIMLDPEGMGISPKHVTLSTSGIVPGIERLGREKVRPKLAISLNASNDEQRDALMPINKRYPLKVLMEGCKNYPLRPWEHVTFEYVMLGDVNDSPEDARRVVRLLAALKKVKVNLIPWNPGELPYRESSPERIEEFRRILNDKGVPAFVRYSRGRDVMAACGQLALLDVGPQSSASTVL